MTTTTRKRSRLNDKFVERLRPPESGRVQVPDSVITGLWLRITEGGVKSWSVSYRVPGRKAPQRLTLGRWPAISCGEARRLAREALLTVLRGQDPAALKRERRLASGDEFGAVAEEWLARTVRGRMRTAADVESQVRSKLVAAWSGRRIGSIGRPDVLRVMDAEMDAGHERGANKLLGTTRRLFLWAVERGHATGDPTAGLKPPGREVSRERVLTDEELAAIWTGSEALGWPWAPYFRLLILTAQRRSEVAGTRWPELDLDRRLWTIPAERSKSNRLHDVPLSDPALEVLEGLPRFAHAPDLLFPTSRGRPLSGYTRAKERLDRLSGVTGWRLHDVRRTATSGMARLGVAPHVLAAVLNHSPAGLQGVTAIYNRHRYAAEMRQALELWGAHVLELAEGRPTNVVPIAGAR